MIDREILDSVVKGIMTRSAADSSSSEALLQALPGGAFEQFVVDITHRFVMRGMMFGAIGAALAIGFEAGRLYTEAFAKKKVH